MPRFISLRLNLLLKHLSAKLYSGIDSHYIPQCIRAKVEQYKRCTRNELEVKQN